MVDLDEVMSMREDQGQHECEVWAAGAEGTYQWKKCTKNPKHTQFIPAPQFTMDHLPEPYRNENVFACIRVITELTVRLKVQCVSMARPDNYVFSNYRGKRIMHTESGVIQELLENDIVLVDDDEEDTSDVQQDNDGSDDDIFKDKERPKTDGQHEENCTNVDPDNKDTNGDDTNNHDTNSHEDAADEDDDWEEEDDKDDGTEDSSDGGQAENHGPCPCPECTKSSEPYQKWYEFNVFTATHVVYDDVEGKNTVAEIFYNDEKSGPTMKKLYGTGLHGPNRKEDGCLLTCVTHDKDLYERLHHLCTRLFKLETKLYETKVKKSIPPLCVIVSYPHGCGKHVTVGEWVERCVKGTVHETVECTQYSYTTATCKGSSGAPVFLTGPGRGKDGTLAYTVHFHSSSASCQTNVSGIWTEI